MEIEKKRDVRNLLNPIARPRKGQIFFTDLALHGALADISGRFQFACWLLRPEAK
jgi:hypothetical protein